jgi:hypothetical protein
MSAVTANSGGGHVTPVVEHNSSVSRYMRKTGLIASIYASYHIPLRNSYKRLSCVLYLQGLIESVVLG